MSIADTAPCPPPSSVAAAWLFDGSWKDSISALFQ